MPSIDDYLTRMPWHRQTNKNQLLKIKSEAALITKENIYLPRKHFYVHHLTVNEIATLFQTSLQNGLTETEINDRHVAFGYNHLTTKKEKTIVQVFLQQFTSVAVYLLLAAAFISFLPAIKKLAFIEDFYTPDALTIRRAVFNVFIFFNVFIHP